MKEKHIDLLALPESRWIGQEVTTICSYTVVHSGAKSYVHGDAIVLRALGTDILTTNPRLGLKETSLCDFRLGHATSKQ